MSNTNIKKVRTSDLELKDRLVSIQRVTKVTKGGRTFSFSAIVVVGNEDGVVGYGLGKASEVQAAIAKGVEDAKKNLVKIPVIKGTIPHKQEYRFGGSVVMIRPAAPGTGIIAGGAMRAVLESLGIKNVLAKSKGSSNPHNLVKATIGALCELRDARSVAQLRGISMNQVLNGEFSGRNGKIENHPGEKPHRRYGASVQEPRRSGSEAHQCERRARRLGDHQRYDRAREAPGQGRRGSR